MISPLPAFSGNREFSRFSKNDIDKLYRNTVYLIYKDGGSMLFHKHLLINARVKDPMNSETEAVAFLEKLVERIDMKIIKGPFASYVDKPGNRGLTAIVMIETSHIAFHIWDEEDPGLMQFDLYTCGELDLPKVLLTLGEDFNIISMDYNLFDRENGFVLEDSGSFPEI
jgi:S-adenosylmethionine/arginine decarboxylase-like enzyme